MITTKQRAYLRGLANKENSIIQIGKGGLTDNLVKTISDALEARELVKITVLETASDTPADLMKQLVPALKCEAVQVVGRKVIVYRESTDADKRKISLPL